MTAESKILLSFTISEEAVLTHGIAEALRHIRLTSQGKVIVPIELGGGMVMGNPAPCGTWIRVSS